jgi:predicted MPP superfamily phosphohydrolase
MRRINDQQVATRGCLRLTMRCPLGRLLSIELSPYLAGIDDAHFYRVDNIEKAAAGIPVGEFSILLSHTPEVYQQASYADFSLLLSGHTDGGQICLPGRIPITLDSVLPRHMGSGSWKYRDMIGYTSAGAGTSIVPARFN